MTKFEALKNLVKEAYAQEHTGLVWATTLSVDTPSIYSADYNMAIITKKKATYSLRPSMNSAIPLLFKKAIIDYILGTSMM